MALDKLSDRDRAVLRSIFDPTATIADVAADEDCYEEADREPNTESEQHAHELCARGVSLAEAGQLEQALSVISEGVAADQQWAPAYNDRAQVLRLLLRDEEAMADIDKVLALTVGQRTKARGQALCQRGVLLRKGGRAEEARAAFAEAAALGSAFAKKQVVELNPYAALCNQMLSQVMRGEEIKL